jgi:hypothetical protein
MERISAAEMEERFGVTAEELDALERDASRGVLHGKPAGKVVMGRPRKFHEETRQIGFREPVGKVSAIERRAAQLGMGRSDYLRHLVDQDLATMEA